MVLLVVLNELPLVVACRHESVAVASTPPVRSFGGRPTADVARVQFSANPSSKGRTLQQMKRGSSCAEPWTLVRGTSLHHVTQTEVAVCSHELLPSSYRLF